MKRLTNLKILIGCRPSSSSRQAEVRYASLRIHPDIPSVGALLSSFFSLSLYFGFSILIINPPTPLFLSSLPSLSPSEFCTLLTPTLRTKSHIIKFTFFPLLMEFLFDLLLTAFFSLLFAFLLSKLFSSSSSTSTSASSHAAAQSTGEGLREEARAPRSREDEDLQEEKIIEVDNVVQKEADRGFLAEEGRAQLGESVATCEGTEGKGDGFLTHVEFQKEKVDHDLVQKDESVELETSIDSDKEKESCENEVEDVKEDQSSVLIYLQDESYFRQEESSGEVKLNEPEVKKGGTGNLCGVEGSLHKMPREVGVPAEEGSCLKEEHEFKIDSQDSVLVHEEVSQDALVSIEFEKVKDGEHNFCEVEGPVSKTATEMGAHLKELIMPEEIPVLAMESTDQKEAEGIEFSEKKKEEEEQEEEDNLFKAEGSTSKMTQLVGVGETDKEKAFIEEEEWVWEGIETTDVEKQFAAAARFAASACGTDSLSKLSNEVQLQLYGLHKVAMDGPCYESHRLALRPSTRAKWYVQFFLHLCD